MEIGLIAIWAIWGSACAALWRFTLPRYVFRFSNKLIAAGLTYAAMLGFFFASIAFIDASGWNFKMANEEPIKKTAEIVFFFSPFGLPLMLGGPIVFVIDCIAALIRRSQKDTQ